MSTVRIDQLRFSAGAFRMELVLNLTAKITGIFGHSGAGKTTLLELIAGLRKPHHGTIQINESTVVDSHTGKWISPEHRHIGYVPQDLALFPHKTVEANLRYGVKAQPPVWETIIEQFQLAPLLHRFPTDLSGGEKQRVAIGRALMTQPSLLMLDEPLSNLDDELRHRGLELFRMLRTRFDIPILYVSHDASELVALCDEVVVIANGRLIAQDLPRVLFQPSPEPAYQLRHRSTS